MSRSIVQRIHGLRWRLALCAFAVLAGASACDRGPTEPSTPVAQLDISGAPSESMLLVGATAQLRAVARDAGGAVLERRTSWSSSNTAIARVSSAGMVTAVSSGVVVITATAGGETAEVGIAVRVAVPVPPSTAGAPVTTALLGNTLSLTLSPGAATASSLTVGRALIITDDTRILTTSAFAIGPAGVTFAAPVSVELSINFATIPPAKLAGVRLYRVTPSGDVAGIAASSVDIARGVLIAPLTQTGTYVAIVPGDPTMLVDAEGTSRRVDVGAAVPGIGVIARDAAGNPVPGASIQFSIEGAAGFIVGPGVALTGIDGRANLPGAWFVGPSKGTYRLRAQLIGAPLSVLFTATAIQPAVAVRIASAPTSGLSGVILSGAIPVELVDEFGDRVEVNQQVTLSLLGSGGTLAGTTSSLAVLGGALFQGQKINGPGTYRIVASSGTLTPDTTEAITITQEAAWLLVLTQPAGAVSGVPFTTQPVVEVRDNANIRMVGDSTLVTAGLQGAGTLLGTRSVRAVNGVATFTNLAVDGAATGVNLSFTSVTTANAFSQSFDVAAPPPGIRLLVGQVPLFYLNSGQVFGPSFQFDLSNRGGANVAALDVTVTWDPARFFFEGRNPLFWRDSSFTAADVTVDESQVAAGILRFTGSTPRATTANFDLGGVILKALPPTSVVETTITAVVNSATNAAGAPVSITVRPTTVTIFPPAP
jgi:hypothetical protein